ncbi:HTH-type transcriptional regulator [Legionella busanensis]|uniref:HTH-type transcriptional regulator n=1 Tax=Legionella busanensis TaxID=190655 RepID=A0A378KEN8_9GAMM|nr:helix-turn-helix domain-containing protein [Legionella busanensis]STX81722.1 HTH-type transcriptional regulator [Legionella busanensis]
MSIGTVLSHLLKKYNLNALELERLTGVPSSTIYRLLKNKYGNPTIEILKKLASFFQITVSQLIGEEPIGCRQIPLVPPSKVYLYLNSLLDHDSYLKAITIDLPLNGKCFATLSQDSMMEPFILLNSLIIVDPEREISNKDFVLLIKDQNELPIIRQIIIDDEDIYLKVLNSNFPLELKKINLTNYQFIGVIVHYRTNLFNFSDTTTLLDAEIINHRVK